MIMSYINTYKVEWCYLYVIDILSWFQLNFFEWFKNLRTLIGIVIEDILLVAIVI